MCVRHVVAPGYPHLARNASLQGIVTVEITISADGRVLSAKGSGAHQLLVSASVDNVRQWRFGSLNGVGASTTTRVIIYQYVLRGKELYMDPPPSVILDLPDRVEITTHPAEPQFSSAGRR
jgi:TonB family protein